MKTLATQPLRLISLTPSNFKGIREFKFEPNGLDTSVYGDNGTGKTTLFDLFLWILFGKDSSNRKDFQIKTIDPATGKAFKGLEHGGTAVLRLPDGSDVTLSRMYTEDWTTKRGGVTEEFSGHTTKYKVNGVSISMTDYNKKVAEICVEAQFRLLTDPRFANEELKWDQLRQILMEVCGQFTDEQVIATNPKLAELPTLLQGKSIDDHKNIIGARMTVIKQEIGLLPTRISEVNNLLPAEPKATATDLKTLRARLQELNEEKTRITTGGEVAEKNRQLAQVKADMQTISTRVADDNMHARAAAGADLDLANRSLEEADGETRKLQRLHEEATAALGRKKPQVESKITEFNDLNATTFEFTGTSVCPTCEQALPADRVSAARDKAVSEFNQRKSKQLETIKSEGQGIRKEVDALDSEIEQLNKQIGTASATAERLRTEAAAISPTAVTVKTVEADPQHIELTEQKTAIESQIQTLDTNKQGALTEVGSRITTVSDDIASAESVEAALGQRVRGLARIEELKESETVLSSEHQELQRQKNMADLFVTAKVSLIEGRVNDLFEHTRFQLFKQQINGSIDECCEALGRDDETGAWVPYSRGLNHGGKVRVGLDMINTFAEFYGDAPPVFIDNAESVTEIIPTTGQQIKLIVSKPDKTLRVEQELTA